MFYVWFTLNRYKKEKKCTCKTRGEIIKNVSEYLLTDTGYKWQSICEYYTDEGKKYVIRNSTSKYMPKYKTGQIVIVHYNPDNCYEAYIECDGNSKNKAIISFVLGIIVIIYLYNKIFS